MTTIYLAGPISLGGSCSADEISAFSRVFKHEAQRLREDGFVVIDPTETTGEASWTWEQWMRCGLRSVTLADVVATLPRWNESRGAMLEAFVATQLRIPVVPAESLNAQAVEKALTRA